MSVLVTILDDTYSANGADGRKRIFASVSLTNPYTANGESITTSTYFKTKFLGGHVTSVSAAVTAANAGIAQTGTFRGDQNSTTAAVLFQMFNAGLPVTANAGLFVDNTVANLSNTTFTMEMIGY
jgi:hypothetical protein